MRTTLITFGAFVWLGAAACLGAESPSGDSVIRRAAAGSEIVITTTSRVAGAIHSLTWAGKEFIDSHDHGRQLQSAINLDVAGVFHAETFNPTEAGSRSDGAGDATTSRLLEIEAKDHTLRTRTQMAFWLRPGQLSGKNPALNTTDLSNHILTKHVTIGYRDFDNVLDYQVTFTLPADEQHKHVAFEALTGYMPPDFDKFWTLDPVTSKLSPLSTGPGEQKLPVIFSTPDSQYAMGIYCPQKAAPGEKGPTYGRWLFKHEKVVKWNCVFRRIDPQGISPGNYSFRMFVIVGTLEQVQATMLKLMADTPRP